MNYPIRFTPLKLPLLLRIFVFSALFPWLAACQTPALNNTSTPEVTITPEANATPEITGNSALADLLAYLPSSWVGRHLPVAWGPAIHFVDVAQIRHDLELGEFTGADEFAAKRDLLLHIANQGLVYLPDKLYIVGSGSFASLGWDIADVAQVLYLPGCGHRHFARRFCPSGNSNGFTSHEARERLIALLLFMCQGMMD
ncbi:MAG: hypothetical protein IPL78_08540 [Chloroflexi bacterium]|nr:hypothetical protein [Chloroflexota bacterium]